jgi:two-component system alkaline phosphatase synthesis response regulator PhoP
MATVLIVEDDPVMMRGLEDNFRMTGYDVLTARDGPQGLEATLKERPDLVILDIMLPGINGYEVCSGIRDKDLDMPIIMLTAKDRDSDAVLGLDVGADDYVRKPFSIRELLARANAFMRRRRTEELPVYEFADCRLDVCGQTLRRGGKEVALTPGQFKMLRLFLGKAGRLLSRDEIRTAVWGYSHFISLKDVDATVAALKSKIERDPMHSPLIEAIGNTGYRFDNRVLTGMKSRERLKCGV